MAEIPIQPKKSLGQNFLYDKNILKKIVRAVQPQPGENVIEIGPGTGALTGHLIGSCRHLWVIEKDKRAVDLLKRRYDGERTLTIVHADVLEVALKELVGNGGRRVRIIGNIPYYITSPLVIHLLNQRAIVNDAMLLLQREAARRIVAPPGSREYGIVSVLAQTWSEISILFKVSAEVFYPKPSVESAVLRMQFRDPDREIRNEDLYREIVRGTFAKRRKMVRGSLHSLFPDVNIAEALGPAGLDKRPEQLTVTDFIQLSNRLNEVIYQH